MDKYIIYTMRDRMFTESVINKFKEKGFSPHSDIEIYIGQYDAVRAKEDGGIDLVNGDNWGSHKELSFRQLCELPPVHDEVEELADEIKTDIKTRWATSGGREGISFEEWVKQQNWCKVRDAVKKKLDL